MGISVLQVGLEAEAARSLEAALLAAAGLCSAIASAPTPDEAESMLLVEDATFHAVLLDARFSGDAARLRVASPGVAVVAIGGEGEGDGQARTTDARVSSHDVELGMLAPILRGALEVARLRRSLDETLAVVSHDLRNPLNVITVATGSMRAGHVPSDRVDGYLAKILRASGRMNRMIQDVVDASRLDAGLIVMERAPHAPSAVVAAALAEVGAGAKERGVQCELDVPDDLPLVHADLARLARALSNLVTNAIQASPAAGTVRVSASATPDAVRFEVRDAGSGIEPARVPSLFHRFVVGRRKALRAGSPGLGLAIARGVALAHDGDIGVESVVGEGSTFFLRIPTAREAG